MEMFNLFWILGAGLAGIIFIGIGVYLKIETNKLKEKCQNSCNGILCELICEKKRDQDDIGRYRYAYFPVYEYEIKYKKYQIRGTLGHGEKEHFEIGKIAEIKYNPENPEEAYVVGDVFSIAWLIFLIVGIIVIIQGLVIGLIL